MRTFSSEQLIIAVGAFGILVVGGIIALASMHEQAPEPLLPIEEEQEEAEELEGAGWPQHEIIGTSVEGRVIEAYTYPSRESEEIKHLVFIGGVHGGYEWNSVLLAYAFLDYFDENPDGIPDDIMVTVIPSANPDGLYAVVGTEGRFERADAPTAFEIIAPGRFNARGVDLNRNFDCKWQPESMWRGNVVSAGSEPFSEPEARAIRDFVLAHHPTAVITWHSQANAVYASSCEEGVFPETIDIMNAYAQAAGYHAFASFDAYEVTGAAEGWLASIGIPALTVELQTRDTIEWERNLSGVRALLDYYRQ